MGGKVRWIVICISIFIIISLSRSVADLWQRRSIVEQERKRLSELEKKHTELTEKFETVQTPAFVEREARERLGMAKEGETIIILEDSSMPQDLKFVRSNNDTPEQLPYWKRWWQVFF